MAKYTYHSKIGIKSAAKTLLKQHLKIQNKAVPKRKPTILFFTNVYRSQHKMILLNIIMLYEYLVFRLITELGDLCKNVNTTNKMLLTLNIMTRTNFILELLTLIQSYDRNVNDGTKRVDRRLTDVQKRKCDVWQTKQ